MSDYQGNIVIKNPATPTGPSTYGRAPGMWKLSEVAYWIKQGVWPDPAIVPDQYFPYVSLLLSTTSLGNANNNLFVDSSGAFNPISRNGNTTQGSFTPYATNWSNYFAGAGSYLQTPANSATTIVGTLSSTANLTIECWIFPTAYNSSANFPGLIGDMVATSENNNWSWGITNTGTLMLYWNISGTQYRAYTTSTVSLNAWTHIALNVAAGAITMYINGVSQSLTGTTTLGTPSGSNNYLVIGQWNNGSGGTGGTSNGLYTGYISNLRVVKASTYTSNFTVPTAPLSAITSTSLLTCQSNRFRDASTNNLTLTVAGSMAVNDFGPFSPPLGTGYVYNQSDITNWSGYFDGTGDYLTVPNNTAFDFGSGNFTIEMWVYRNNATNPYALFAKRNSSDTETKWIAAYINTNGTIQTQVSVNGSSWAFNTATTSAVGTATWAHVAFVRNGSDYSVYVDGVKNTISSSLSGSVFTDTNPVEIGQLGLSGSFLYSMNGSISNFRIVKGTAVYTATFTPPTSPLTAISGTSLLTLQNAAFTDNSTNNFIITPFGNTTVTGNSPFNTTGYWSNYFDGSGDYLTAPSNAAFAFGTGDFTIEAWVNVISYSGTCSIFDTRTAGNEATGVIFYVTATGAISIYNSGTLATSSGTISTNTWAHVAVTRSGTTVTFWINGVSSGTATVSTNFSQQNSYIGTAYNGSSNPFYGYVSNLRVVKGTAVYTSNFTVPTTPLTAISGTSLLTCQNGRFIDNSTNNFTITRNGDVSVQSFDPFYTATIASNGGSLYLDGSGDYLTSPTSQAYNFGSSNFTIEGWFYFTNSTANALQTLYSNYTSFSSAGSIFFGKHTNNSGYVTVWFSSYSTGGPLLAETTYPPNNAWTHYALVRNGNTFTLYRNGVSTASASWSGAATAGANAIWVGAAGDAATSYNFPGYINGFRISKTAVYTAAFTPPTAPVTPTAATTLLVNGMNAGIYDATTINDMETVGNAQVSTAVSKFGGSSVYFDGTDDRLVIPTTPQFGFGTGDYTIEFWLYMSALPGTKYTLLDFRTASTAQPHTVYVSSSGYMGFYNGSADVTSSSQPLSINTWYHVAYSRGSGTLKIFVAGTQAYSASNTIDYQATRPLSIGGAVGGIEVLNGYIDDLRITKGVARYTSNFTPPTQAFPVY